MTDLKEPPPDELLRPEAVEEYSRRRDAVWQKLVELHTCFFVVLWSGPRALKGGRPTCPRRCSPFSIPTFSALAAATAIRTWATPCSTITFASSTSGAPSRS